MRIALDVDDVIAAFTPHAFAWYGVTLRRTDYWSVPNMNEILGEGWFPKLAVQKEFWETIPALGLPEDIDFHVDYYISSFPKELYSVRLKWLRDKEFPDAPLVISNNKKDTCESLGITYLVDDKPQTIIDLEESPITTGIHFITPYAGFNTVGKTIESLTEVNTIIFPEKTIETHGRRRRFPRSGTIPCRG
jgi:hypothetical protein